MGLYKRNDSPFYWMTFRIEGRKVFENTGTKNKALAERIHAKRLIEITERKWFPREPESDFTLDQLFDKYLAEVSPQLAPSSHERNRQMVKRFKAFFGETLLREVTPAMVSRFKGQLLEGHRPGTVLRELGVLRRVFSIAIQEWELCRENPVSKVIRTIKNADNKIVRYLAPEETSRLMVALPPWLRPIVVLARHTGLRRGNLLGLTWEQVDLARGVVVIPRTKNGCPIGLPLTETAKGVLREAQKVRHLSSPYVFFEPDGKPYTGGKVHVTFKRACQRAGIDKLRFHDLRHDFASSLVQRGVAIQRVKELLGHKDLRMTLRYAHLSPESLAESVRVLDRGENQPWGQTPKGGGQTPKGSKPGINFGYAVVTFPKEKGSDTDFPWLTPR